MNAAQHFRAAELAVESFGTVEPHEFTYTVAEAISHALLALTGAIMLKGMAGHYPAMHDDLMNAVIGRAPVSQS